MKDIVIIIPIHEFNDNIKTLVDNAINSVPKDIEIRLSLKHGLTDEIHKAFGKQKNIVIYEDTNETAKSDFSTLVNQAVGDSKWFSILELDDEYTSIWFDNVEKYIDYNPDVSIFMPLNDLIDFNKKTYMGIGNEAAWASSFSNEIGYIDKECLDSYFDFYLTGSVFNTEDWIQIGGLKTSMKISFWYEFLLRLTNKDKKVFVIPKIGYKHYFNRENSLMDSYTKNIDKEESTWWFELAKQECFHKEDRQKTYTKK